MFTIGKFAKIHEINKKTLMWYDEIGILKPSMTDKNGYRYYSYEQSSALETILMLRELDVPISEIRDFLNNRNAESYKELIDDTLCKLKLKIQHLSQTEKILETKSDEAANLCRLNLDEITLTKKKRKKYLSTITTNKNKSLEEEIEEIISETRNQQINKLHNASYGAMLPAENIYSGNFSSYSHLFIELPSNSKNNNVHIQPAGMYIRAFCKGKWENLPDKYIQIYEYCNENNLELIGYSYEKGINDFIIDSIDDYITQIEIPVKSK